MDCVEAQGMISAGMDREPVPASSLAQAKEHCRTCPQCSAFVSTQLAARQAPLPKPPVDLVERTMARVRMEAENMAAERAAAEATAAAEAAAASKSQAAATNLPTSGARASEIHVPSFVTPTLAPKPKRERRLDRRWTSIAVAAAAVVALVGTGVVVSFGMRLVSPQNPDADRREVFTLGEGRSGAAPQAAAPSEQGVQTPGPDAITVKGLVYVRGASSNVDTATLASAGTFSSSLNGGSTSTRNAYRDTTSDSLTIYAADDAGDLWEFKPVTRDYLGDTYALVSKELTRFGQWPTLPNGIEAPADDQGGTTFDMRGTDSTGARVFIPSTPLTGYGSEVVVPGVSSVPPMIALAPRTAGDMLAEDPYWTLWLQLP